MVLGSRPSLSAVRYPVLCSYFSLLDAFIWDVSRNTLLAYLSLLIFSYNTLLTPYRLLVPNYCLLLVTGLMVLLAHRSSTYADPRLMLLIACCTSTASYFRYGYSLFAVRSTMFALRSSLSFLFSRCFFFAVRCLLIVLFLFLAVGPYCSLLVPCRSPLNYMPLDITCSLLTAHRSLFLSRRQQIAVCSSYIVLSGLLRVTHFS